MEIVIYNTDTITSDMLENLINAITSSLIPIYSSFSQLDDGTTMTIIASN